MRPYLILALAWLALAGRTTAAERVDYLREVKPLLSVRCYACHGALQQKSGLRVDTVRSIFKGGDSGPVVVPGKADESPLLAHVSGARGVRRMPPPGEGEQLVEKQIALLRAWIEQGANGPADERPEPDPREHWAFRPPVRPPIPPVKDASRVRNVVDVFLMAAREKHRVVPQGPADRRLLLRRVYLDLVGLPPTRAEQVAFLADPSPDAYEKVVDHLLASPQYGERWARHWMDVWRYSDWWGLGAEVRNSQKHIWHYRDWIRESLNADAGYDEMVRQMLAADELYPNDLSRLRATGFLVRPYFIFNRNTWLEEVIEHTGKGILGLTLNCAKCHDHKYDPIRQEDYYRLRAIFEPYQVRTDQVPGEVDFTKDGIPRVFDCNLDSPTYRFLRGDERRPIKDKPLKPALPPLLAFRKWEIQPVALPTEAHSPQLRSFVLDNYLKAAERDIQTARAAKAKAELELAEAKKRPPAPAATAPTPWNTPVSGTAVVADDFARPSPEVWMVGPGKWKHGRGKLQQLFEGEERSWLQLRRSPPADFEARFRFRITGGDPWRSVGIVFDAGAEQETLVYVSAHTGDPKVQVALKQGGGQVYPDAGRKAWPIKVNEPIELVVRVRGPLINVGVNGTFVLAYRQPRHSGELKLITYAATADFERSEVRALPKDVVLSEPAGTGLPKEVPVPVALAALVVAEKGLALAELQPRLLRARDSADRARLATPPVANAGELARAAARLEKQAAVADLELKVANFDLGLQKSAAGGPMMTPQAAKEGAALKEKLAAARKALDAPGDTYTPLHGALKAPESNLETEASRDKPFPTTSTGRRSMLAKWLTDGRHPLTARVAANHIWARHFGKPLVPTVFDFGRKGAPPTHPELLDFLAVDLIEHGWSMKYLHRLLVTSDAYRMTSSTVGVTAMAADPENRWYWKMNAVRMEAQVVRDSLLQLAGELDTTLGGPSIDPVGQEGSRRRSLYFVHSHNDHHHFLSMFDDASVLECYRRTESIVPQQALALSNSGFALTQAGKINTRLREELGEVPDAVFVKAAFELVLASSPTPAEQAECEAAIKDLTELLRRAGVANAVHKARADLIAALLNHNDFITIR
jgi:hypothetical protein